MPLTMGGRNSLRHLSPALLRHCLEHTHPHPAEPVVAPTTAANTPAASTVAETPPVTPDPKLTEPMAH